ncbi:GNAT family N-acetyltransferase [Psychromarinibacter halotolerans]|uniref:GNAT family N-acetyltransferase n=1 Tax=Psychromarinibacter halotolerans TaxID=1775175 RepID=A0ABV7GVE0_9RHOB|nr:GNAT family N-acetyltransferase [Psychromarinibacter halotolerans]MDF0594833.1 GNAT family N-acetyltransferase [Psychromarinibacter halotolerans]
MIPEIRTDRLLLRRLRPADAPALAEGIAEYAIVKWLTRVPWPYTLKDAEDFVDMVIAENGAHYAVTEDDRVLGIVSTQDELGYWLRSDAQGRGIMSEAAAAATDAHFASGADRLVSGHHPDNTRSRRILLKLGFTDTHTETKHSQSLGPVTIQRMALTADHWQRLRRAAD